MAIGPLGTNSNDRIASPAPPIPLPPPLPGKDLPQKAPPASPPIGIIRVMRGDGDPPGSGPPLKGEPLNVKGEHVPALLAYTLLGLPRTMPCTMPCASRALSAFAAIRYLSIGARFYSLGFS